MIIGERLRALRERKQISQGDIEKRTGLLRCYISRVENGHTVPSIETIEKLARALEVPMYQIFYEGEEPPSSPTCPNGRRRKILPGGTRARMPRCLGSSEGCWAGRMKRIAGPCCSWPRRWLNPIGRRPDSERVVADRPEVRFEEVRRETLVSRLATPKLSPEEPTYSACPVP
jgi:transcriptional regulator with XRE-family HTH domain